MPPFPELKDISPPTPPPFSSPEEVQQIVWWIFGGCTGALLLAAVWLWWKWRVRQRAVPPPPQPALDHLHERLAALHPLAATQPAAEIGQKVGDAVRSYLQRQHGLLAHYRTTEELFGTTAAATRRHGAPPPLPFLRPFEDVFTQCDALKFAGASSPLYQRTSLIDAALAATESVRASLARPPITPAPHFPPPLPPLAVSQTPPPLPSSSAPSAPSAPSAQPAPSAPSAPSVPSAPSAPSAQPAPPQPESRRPSIPFPPPLPLPPPADAAAAGKESAEISSADSPSSAQTPDISATVPADATVLPPSFIPAPLVAAVRHRDDAFTHPQPSAFARGADVIPS